MKTLLRITYALAGLVGLACLVLISYVLIDLRSYEYEPLVRLLGVNGILLLAFLVLGIALLTARLIQAAIQSKLRLLGAFGLLEGTFYALWFGLFLWLAQWILLERPVTVRIAESQISEDRRGEVSAIARLRAEHRGDVQALSGDRDGVDVERFAVMIDRVFINRPEVFADHGLGQTIASYANRYDVPAELLMGWLYLDSFYGEAVSGPMPMFRGITGETFRDLIQLHLPSWFVESRIRTYLIEGPLLEALFGSGFGNKLRYALQKATYDISLEPYEADVFSDVLLVMVEFPEEFEYLDDPALMTPYRALIADGLKKPYGDAYLHERSGPAYYDSNRRHLIDFARAATYRTLLDFDFATRVQALVARYYNEQFESALGQATWAAVSDPQKMALSAMIVDVFRPNIGRLGYNVYMLPEFNLAPFDFVVGRALEEPEALLATGKIWRPADDWKLWGGPTKKLRTVMEVASAMTGCSSPDSDDSTRAAINVLAGHY